MLSVTRSSVFMVNGVEGAGQASHPHNGLGKRDKVHDTIRPSSDPVLGQLLEFLARDVASQPERLQILNAGLVQRLQSLVDA